MKIPALVINLKSSTERRERMERLLSPFADILDVRFVEGIDGRGLSEEEKRAALCGGSRRKWERKSAWCDGEIGCALSHRKCFQKIVDDRLDYALILEDDLEFSDGAGLRAQLELAKRFFESREESAALDLSFRYAMLPKTLLCSDDGQFEVHPMTGGVSAVAYFLNRKAAEEMIRKNTPLRHVLDDWTDNVLRGLPCFVIHPSVFIAEHPRKRMDSIIQKTRGPMWNAEEKKGRCHKFRTRLSRILTPKWWFQKYNRVFRKAITVDPIFGKVRGK